MRIDRFVFGAAFLINCHVSVPAFGQGQNESVVSVITNRACSLEAVRTAIGKLEKSSQPPRFWTSLANDSAYGIAHRRLFVLELFRGFVRPGMRMGEIATMLNGQKWLQTNHVNRVTDVVGRVPVNITPEDTVFVIRILPKLTGNTPAVYLRIRGAVGEQEFVQMLSGEGWDSKTASSELKELAVSEP